MNLKASVLIAAGTALVTAGAAVPACGADLWQGVSAGMTPAQVTTLFSDAQPAEFDEQDGSGSGLAAFRQIDGHRAEVDFHFAYGLLDGVAIQFGGKIEPLTNEGTETLKATITGQWGGSVRCDPPVSHSEFCQRLKDGVAMSVLLLRSQDPSAQASLVIGLQPAAL